MTPLRADVYIAPPIPWKKPDGSRGGFWSPCSCTLIHGEKEAVLVDTAITNAQNKDLADWIQERIPNKRLITIYITHGHGDHFLGIGLLLKRFPSARAVSTLGTLEHMKQQIDPRNYPKSWGTQFKGEIDEGFQLTAPLPKNNEFYLEGHLMRAIEVGQADTHDSTILWVPDLKLAVCGDVVYGDVHQMLAECNTKDKRLAWIESVKKVEALKPELVVPGHMKAGEIHGAFHLAATRKYIEDFNHFIDSGAKNARELSQLMTKQYPSRFNPGALIAGCMAAFKKPPSQSRM